MWFVRRSSGTVLVALALAISGPWLITGTPAAAATEDMPGLIEPCTPVFAAPPPAAMVGLVVVINHSSVSGTRLIGDPRPHTPLVRAAGFRWNAKRSFWYIPDSPDRPADTVAIDHLAGQLRELGFKVEIDI